MSHQGCYAGRGTTIVDMQETCPYFTHRRSRTLMTLLPLAAAAVHIDLYLSILHHLGEHLRGARRSPVGPEVPWWVEHFDNFGQRFDAKRRVDGIQ